MLQLPRRLLVSMLLAWSILGLTPACAGMAQAWAEQLPLPPNLIALDSQEGKRLLFESEVSTAYFPLSEQFVTQQNQAFCGVASLVMVLNALHLPAPASAELAPFAAFDQQNIFTAQAEAAVSRTVIEENGMTLDQLGALARASGLQAEVHHAADSNLDTFRKQAIARLGTPDQYVLVNFLRTAIGQEKYGHISPLAAYDAQSDRFLLLDVSRYKYPPIWVSAKELFAAMNTVDSSNQSRSRGYVEITR
ncbi:MAG: phytochelatin synthase family protein [Dongiaceae bacterium]